MGARQIVELDFEPVMKVNLEFRRMTSRMETRGVLFFQW
jgi:hypothetical protein